MCFVVKKEPSARKEFLNKLDNIRNGKFTRVKNFSKEFGLKNKKGFVNELFEKSSKSKLFVESKHKSNSN